MIILDSIKIKQTMKGEILLKLEDRQQIINRFDDFLYKNSYGSCRPRERMINIGDTLNGLIDILNTLEVEKWFSVMIMPEEYKQIIVLDDKGQEHDYHYWNGYRYYKLIDKDGYPSDVNIVSWKYK
jgi:hypothetical protein